MTKFEDQLLGQLMAEHGHELRAMSASPVSARRRYRRPAWVAAGAAGTAAAATAVVMALGSAPAMAYSVSQHDGMVAVSVDNATGIAGANRALSGMNASVVVVLTGTNCPSIGSFSRPDPMPRLAVRVAESTGSDGSPAVKVKIKGKIPAGDTMILAFSGNQQQGSVGAGGIITGQVPSCVSIPSAPSGSGTSGSHSGSGRSTSSG